MKLFRFKTEDKTIHFVNVEQITELITTDTNHTIIRLSCGKELKTAVSILQMKSAFKDILSYDPFPQPLSE